MSATENQVLTAFVSAIKNRATGILKIHSETTLRLFMFSKGTCVDIGSNVRDELPGSFLFQQKKMNDGQYQTYLQKCSVPKTNQWALANSEIQLDSAILLNMRSEYSKKIISNLTLSKVTQVQFQTLPELPTEQPIIETILLLLNLISKFSIEQIQAFKTEFQDPTTKISVTKIPDKNILNDDQAGLFTVIQHNATLSEVLDSSFLEKEKIYQWMLAFELSGLIRTESPVESEKRKFFESFTDEQKKNLEWLKKESQKIIQGNFYDALDIENGGDAEDIAKGFESSVKKFENPNFQNLFFRGEDNLAAVILKKINHAYYVLSNPEKKREYDSFLLKGSGDNFLDQSQTIQEEKLLSQLNDLMKARKFDEAIVFLGQKIEETPQFIKLYSTIVDLVRELKMIASEELNQKIFNWFKLGISKNPQESQLFLLLGEWCMLLSQQNNALKAFQKALHIRAGSNKLRNYILQIDSVAGRQIIVEAIYQNLETLSHFELLGVEPNASEKDIRDAYREMSKHIHPDRFFNSTNQSLKEMSKRVYKEMVASNLVLKDEQKRKEYSDHLFSSQRKKDEKQKTILPKSMQAKKYYDQAVIFLEDRNFSSAKLNIQLALSYEPDNYLLQKMLKEVQAKLSNTIV